MGFNTWFAPPAPDWTGLPLRAKPEMNQFGFPDSFVAAFERTAQEIQGVVCSRVPGRAALDLIQAGHDLKSFYVHGKSCNWGPMSGFIAQLPPLNKSGYANADFNRVEHTHSVKLLRELVVARRTSDAALVELNRQRAAKNPPEKAYPSDPALAKACFVPLRLTTQTMQAIRDADQKLGPGDRLIVTDELNTVAGLAWNDVPGRPGRPGQPADALLEWAAIRDPGSPEPQWSLYHRQIWVRAVARLHAEPVSPSEPAATDLLVADWHAYLSRSTHSGDESRFLFDSLDPELDPDDTGVQFGASAASAATLDVGTWLALDARRRAIIGPAADSDPLAGSALYPLRGAQNPYPPYPQDNPIDAARNAVAGDYDLFAVWPYVGAMRGDAIRLSEQKTTDAPAAAPLLAAGAVFRPALPALGSRPYTVEAVNQPGFLTEVIPSPTFIKPLEDEVKGNINQLVEITVSLLNSMVTAELVRSRAAPNAAFHSDEGGRPGISSIDLPVAVFLPPELVPARAVGRSIVVSTVEEFVVLLERLAGRCQLTLNHAWLCDMFAKLAETRDENAQPVNPRIGTLAASQHDPTTALGPAERIASLLAGREVRWDALDLPDWFTDLAARLGQIAGSDPRTTQTMTNVGLLAGRIPLVGVPTPIWQRNP